MSSKILAFLQLIFLWKCAETEGSIDSGCILDSGKKQGFNLSIQSKRIESGYWVTNFVVNGDMENKTDLITLDLKHNIVDCGDKKIFQIRGAFKDTLTEDQKDKIVFYPKCGSNVAITNNGWTIQKLNGEDRFNGVVFTSRPLRLDELFEVKIDKRIEKTGYFMGIGVTTHSPSVIDIPHHINSMKTGTWVLYHNHIYRNGDVIDKNRVPNLDKLQVGNRVGILVSKTGSLHLYINGVDQGPAASNIPANVFGIFELFGEPAQACLKEEAGWAGIENPAPRSASCLRADLLQILLDNCCTV